MNFMTKIAAYALVGMMAMAPAASAKTFLKFSGGPSGGTFQYFSNGMAVRLSQSGDLKVSNQASRGSVENIRKVSGDKAHFGIAYSGDIFLAANGQLSGDTTKYGDVYAVSYLYNAPAQLTVLAKSGIKSVMDLKGKKVALGGPGSGAAAAGERFFKLVGMWDSIDRQFLGYDKAASAMKDGHVDAMWILAGYPTRAVIELGATDKITLLPLREIAEKNGMSKEMPYYQPLDIPANTYEGVTTPTSSFFDSALWIASKSVSADVVYAALKDIYSEEGLKYMISVKSTAKQMTVADGVKGIVTPLHPGAIKFWKEKGLTITPAMMGGM